MVAIYRVILIALASLSVSLSEAEATKIDPAKSLPPVETQAIAISSEAATQSSVQDAGCSEGKDYRESDLCAQWKAADAARDAANWSWWQMWLSAAGVLGLGVTLWFNFRAIRLAEKEAEETKGALVIAQHNAEAAASQVQLSKEIATAQLRPYVYAEVCTLNFGREMGHRPLKARVTLRNFGSTPALNLRIWSNWFVAPFPPTQEVASVKMV